MLELKLNVVNKREYEENYNYREVIIKLPKTEEELKRDFEYLGLDYKNLSIQDSHILDCEVIDTNDPHFSGVMSTKLSNIIDRASSSGWTTPYQDIKSMYAILTFLNENERDKFLAVLEFKREQISNMADAVKFGNNLDCFNYYPNVQTTTDYSICLIQNGEFKITDELIKYLDLESMGTDLLVWVEHKFTDWGLIVQEKDVMKKLEDVIVEETEEFE